MKIPEHCEELQRETGRFGRQRPNLWSCRETGIQGVQTAGTAQLRPTVYSVAGQFTVLTGFKKTGIEDRKHYYTAIKEDFVEHQEIQGTYSGLTPERITAIEKQIIFLMRFLKMIQSEIEMTIGNETYSYDLEETVDLLKDELFQFRGACDKVLEKSTTKTISLYN